MKSIGFKNFRKFVEFPELKLGEITLLVGQNNAGKSTLIKAVRLIMNYLHNSMTESFSFADDSVEGGNIITFDRALCKNQNDSFVEFKVSLPDFSCIITITGDMEKQMVNGQVTKVKVFGGIFCLSIDYLAESIRVETTFHNENEPTIRDGMDKLEKLLVSMKKDLKSKNPEDDEYINLNSEIKKITTKKRQLQKTIKNNGIYGFDVSIDSTDNWHTHDISTVFDIKRSSWDECLKIFIISSKIQLDLLLKTKKRIKGKQKAITQFESIVTLEKDLLNFSEILSLSARMENYQYWKAESRKQSAVLSTKDSENALVRIVHEYFQAKISHGELEHLIVLEWMRKFEVGADFRITPFGGEAYLCEVKELETENYVYLADKGMGSIQIMTLLFKLATIIRSRKNFFLTLIIEEPELNLHPKLQSKLADLFLQMHNDFGIKFIIETHSEYLIRRTQVMVAEKNFKDERDLSDGNPFEVYYFPSSGNPYSMGYTVSGRFLEKFDEGFFDEASKSTIALSRNEIERRG